MIDDARTPHIPIPSTVDPGADAADDETGSTLDAVQSTLARAGRSTAEVVRNNPTPTALIAAGAGLLLLGGALVARSDDGGDARTPEAPPPGRRDAERSVPADRPVRTEGEGTTSASSTLSSALAEAERAGDRVRDWTGRQPLAAGALALLAGAAVGMLFPKTAVEDRLVGEQRDALLERAHDTVRSGARSAQAGLDEARAALHEGIAERDLDTQSLKQRIHTMVEEVESLADTTLSRAREAARDADTAASEADRG